MSLEVRGPARLAPATTPEAPSNTATSPTSITSGPRQQRGFGLDGISAPQIVAKAAASSETERLAQLGLLARAFYPVGHPNLHVAPTLDLNRIGQVGRVDEVGRLKSVALTMPHALAGEYRFSPKAADAPSIDLTCALEHHAALAQFFLDRGVNVHLLLQHDRATEAVYTTDIVTGIANKAVVSSPLHEARALEAASYQGGTRLDPAPRGKLAAVEWGDFLLAKRDGTIYALQGFGSMRGTPESVDRLGRSLKRIARDSGVKIEHVPIGLRGADTLHLDYAVNYAGSGTSRSMIVCPDAIADANDIDRLSWIFETPDAGVFAVSRPEMLEAAANISNFSPTETLIAANAHTEATAEFLRSRGVTVHALPFVMTEKDGSFHCCVGQLLRQ